MPIGIKKIKASLIEQLKLKDADIDLFKDLIDDYIFLCKQEKKMQKDVAEKGIVYTAVSAHGKEYERENPSLKLAVLYNRQKLNILAQLGLSTQEVDNRTDGDDDCGL